METVAVSILKRAVEMDQKEQYTMALALYQEGVRILLDIVKGIYARAAHVFPVCFLRVSLSLSFIAFLSYRLCAAPDSLRETSEFRVRDIRRDKINVNKFKLVN